jgi:hypothetical protein
MSRTLQKGYSVNKERLWTKDFITVAVINLLLYLVFYLLMVTIASYAVDTFHTSTGTAGLVSGIFIIGARGFSSPAQYRLLLRRPYISPQSM